ncbi:hypothetical protein D9M73_281780 [compost metagenome]
MLAGESGIASKLAPTGYGSQTTSRCTLLRAISRASAVGGGLSVMTRLTSEIGPRRTMALRPNLLESAARKTCRALAMIACETRTS